MTTYEFPVNAVTATSLRAIPVFWTGGMDSTFRVLDLAIHYQCKVQPIYVIDRERRSLQNELSTIELITKRVFQEFPSSRELILPLMKVERQEIPVDPEVSRKYRLLRGIEDISWQYEWLANVSSVTGLKEIELGVKGITRLFRLLKDNSERYQYPCGASSYRLKEWNYADDYEEGASLFNAFSFPILHIDKSQLEETAKEHGFAHLLNLIWFCHYPWGSSPCGACAVCRSFIADNGLLKMPKGTRFRHRFWFLVHPTRLLVLHPDRFIARLRDYVGWLRGR